MNAVIARPPTRAEYERRYAWFIRALTRECDEVRTEVGDYGWRFDVMVEWRRPRRLRHGVIVEWTIDGRDISLYRMLAELPTAKTRWQFMSRMIRMTLRQRPAGWEREVAL